METQNWIFFLQKSVNRFLKNNNHCKIQLISSTGLSFKQLEQAVQYTHRVYRPYKVEQDSPFYSAMKIVNLRNPNMLDL